MGFGGYVSMNVVFRLLISLLNSLEKGGFIGKRG